MKKTLCIFLFFNMFSMANTPTNDDLNKAIFTNGNGEGSNKTTQISLVVDINQTNIAQFNIIGSILTTIDKTNHSYLINKITYRSENPIIAKIKSSKLILVFDLQDKNDTSISGNLVIEDSVFRDGTTGGATHSNTLTVSDISDKATPILLSAHTIDNNTSGHIDNIKLTFTEIIKTNNNQNSGFSVSSHTVLGVSDSKGNGENNNSNDNGDKHLYLRLQESSSFDTGVQPSVSYSENSSNKLQDHTAENNISSISSFVVVDKAIPIFKSAYAKSVHNGADIVTIGFSEPIFKPLILGTDISMSGGPDIPGATLTYFNDDKNITIELNESISGRGYIEVGSNPSVNIFASAKDRNGNNFVQKNIATPAVLETIKPKLLSIAKLGDEGHFLATFDEPMSSFTKSDIELQYSGTAPSAPYEYGVTLSQSKKTAILEVASLPAFTEEETRTFTFIMKSSVKDLAGNSIESNESNGSHTLAKDSTPPTANDFTVNINSKTIVIDFNDSIAIDTFYPEGILISRHNEGNISLTSSSTAIYEDQKITITLNDDIDSLKSFLKDKEDFNISIFVNSGIVDLAHNACETKNIPLSSSDSSFVADNVKPNLLNWDFDLDNKKMTLNFDEPMKVIDYNAGNISISNSNTTSTNKIVFNTNSSSANLSSDKSIDIVLFGSQIIKILNDDLAKDINRTFLEINTTSGFQDIKGNHASLLTDATALRAKIYKANKNKVSILNIIPTQWNHISINRPTNISDILASGTISHIYSYSNEVWYPSPSNIDPKIGYWIKAGESNSNILEIPSTSDTYIKGTKVADLDRIQSKIDGVFHLIGIENNLTYEEMYDSKNTICKSMRIHHYDSASTLSESGWDKNSTVLANSSLWVQCVK